MLVLEYHPPFLVHVLVVPHYLQGQSVHGASPLIYRGLHLALESVAVKFLNIYGTKIWRLVQFYIPLCSRKEQASVVEAVSMSALKILSSGYNSATEKNRAVYTVMA